MNFENINFNDYEVNTPYPQMTSTEKDEKILPDLIDLYTGPKSELTAFTQHIYQSFITKQNENYMELSKLLEDISIRKLKHLEILSQILISQKVNPKFCKYIDNNYNICSSWSSNNVKYLTDVKDFIKYNITLEKSILAKYNNILNNANNENIIEIISRIIQDENSYLEIFNKILEIIENG